MIGWTDSPQDSQWLALRDVAARGTTNAVAVLSEMIGRNIRIHTPTLSLVALDELVALLEAPEETVAAVYLAIRGDATGHILLVMSLEEAHGLVDMVMDQAPGTTRSLGGLERSALGEVGNLASSFFLNALAEVTGMSLQPSPPAVLVDMYRAVLSVPLAALAATTDESLVIKTVFMDEGRSIEAAFLVMPDMPSLTAILRALERRWRIR